MSVLWCKGHVMTTASRTPRTHKFSRLDIIGEHELQVRQCDEETIDGRCSCGFFQQSVSSRNLTAYERMTDAFLKHVQAVRDAIRGQTVA